MTLVQTVSTILQKSVTEKEAKEFANNHFDLLFEHIKTVGDKQDILTDLLNVATVKLVNGLYNYFKEHKNESININLFDLNRLKEVDVIKLAKIQSVGKRTIYDFIELLDQYSLNVNRYETKHILKYQRYQANKKQSFFYIELN